MKILLRLSFDGGSFSGFQFQPGRRTVQGELTSAATALYREPCFVTGCSRTDAGVHATGFCATLSFPDGRDISGIIPAGNIPAALNALLPEDVSVDAAVPVDDGFHPRYSVIDKTYEYLIGASARRAPLLRNRIYIPRVPIGSEEVAVMDAAARRLVGRHDFRSFMAAGSKIRDTVRNMRSASVTASGDTVRITLCADGFLYNMVRIIAGTLLDIGTAGKDPSVIDGIVAARDRGAAGRTLPAHALYLTNVNYGETVVFPDRT